ncbi:transposase, partial [Salmonella enterica subsp. enterica serovar Carmel]|nr:transposase [Salmonella enterica subsp. enterica serovar Carmel]
KRAEEKLRDAEDEGITVLEHKQPEPWIGNIYQPVGNTVTVQQAGSEEEYDEQADVHFQRGLQLLAARQKKDPLE